MFVCLFVFRFRLFVSFLVVFVLLFCMLFVRASPCLFHGYFSTLICLLVPRSEQNVNMTFHPPELMDLRWANWGGGLSLRAYPWPRLI